MVGKKYLLFQQKWFSHIEHYFSDDKGAGGHSPSLLWTNVVDRASLHGVNLPMKDQRIVVSSLVYHVRDIMVEQMKKV